MTGGQAMDGELTVDRVAAQVAEEGAARVVIVSDDTDQYPAGTFGKGVAIHPRADLDQVQRQLRDVAGVTVLTYHPTCPTARRPLRNRGKTPNPQGPGLIHNPLLH